MYPFRIFILVIPLLLVFYFLPDSAPGRADALATKLIELSGAEFPVGHPFTAWNEAINRVWGYAKYFKMDFTQYEEG